MKTPAVPLTARGILVLIAALVGLSTLLSFATSANHADDSSHLLSLKRRSPKFRDYNSAVQHHHPLENRDEECEGDQACRDCGPPVVFASDTSIAARAEYYTQDQARNASSSSAFSSSLALARRTIIEPAPGTEEAFMLEEIPKATQMVWQVPLPPREGGGEVDVNTARFLAFNNDNAISLGTSHLCGCTSLVIISHRGVYATHYWEDISFDPRKKWRLTPAETNDEVFERTVTGPLRQGKRLGRALEQQRLDPSQIGGGNRRARDNVRAFLIRPDGPPRKAMMGEYERKWQQIKETVGSIVSVLDPNTEEGRARWQEVIYVPKDKQNANLGGSADGRILVKYDPKHEGKKKVILWVERSKIYEDEWEF